MAGPLQPGYFSGGTPERFHAANVTLPAFPSESSMRWRRLDAPGREEARVARVATGWRLTGEVAVEDDGVAASLRYRIDCDASWATRSALVKGEVGGLAIHVALAADGNGRWTRDGAPLPELDGALDVDLGFTPATNMLPIRRLALAVGETGLVRGAWLRFPDMRLEPLDQTYTREAESVYRYRALLDGEHFTARLHTDAFGRVRLYEGLWIAELAIPEEETQPVQR